MLDVLIGIGIGLAMVAYLGIGLAISIFIEADELETTALFIVWPLYVTLVLIILFFYGCYRLGVLVKSRVYRRQRYFERRRKKNQNEKML